MLVLNRKKGEKIVLGENLVIVTVVEIGPGNKVRLGFEAPSHVPIYRQEIWELMKSDGSYMKGEEVAADNKASSESRDEAGQ